jgi:hypothetical protein
MLFMAVRERGVEVSSEIIPFGVDSDLEVARRVSEKFARSGVLVKAIGKEVLASLEEGGLPLSTYEKLARMCHNKNPDNRFNSESARELSKALFGCVIQTSR